MEKENFDKPQILIGKKKKDYGRTYRKAVFNPRFKYIGVCVGRLKNKVPFAVIVLCEEFSEFSGVELPPFGESGENLPQNASNKISLAVLSQPEAKSREDQLVNPTRPQKAVNLNVEKRVEPVYSSAATSPVVKRGIARPQKVEVANSNVSQTKTANEVKTNNISPAKTMSNNSAPKKEELKSSQENVKKPVVGVHWRPGEGYVQKRDQREAKPPPSDSKDEDDDLFLVAPSLEERRKEAKKNFSDDEKDKNEPDFTDSDEEGTAEEQLGGKKKKGVWNKFKDGWKKMTKGLANDDKETEGMVEGQTRVMKKKAKNGDIIERHITLVMH